MIERDQLIRVLQEAFGADCDLSVLLPTGEVLPIIGAVYGPNITEDCILIAEGADINYMGEGAVLLSKK